MDYRGLWHRLAKVYDRGEAQAIARTVYEVRYGLTLADLLMGRDSEVPQDELEALAARLERQEPVQYVLGEADFCGRRFHVRHGVLIPRPETEELCRWIAAEIQAEREAPGGCTVLDIGTGSGCIAVTLAAELPEARVTAWDISEEALAVARTNAARLGTEVTFSQTDILGAAEACQAEGSGEGREPCGGAWDVIVSNPPYICLKERAAMAPNVLEHEPQVALFVPDDDPLRFYRAIAQYGQWALKRGGQLFFEINPLYATALRELLSTMAYHDIETRADAYGKERMMRARR